MTICSTCRKEMTCVCTGKMAVFGGDHVYAGDEFRCSGCGAAVVVTSGTSYHMYRALAVAEQRLVLNMDDTPAPASPALLSSPCPEEINA